jgi:hypothetical protein
MDKLIKSLEYSSLDHKWVARNYLKEQGWEQDVLFGKLQSPEFNKGIENIMIKIALSSFRYYIINYDNITKDASLAAVTSLCSSGVNSVDVDSNDPEVYYLSHLFNNMIGSTRKLLKCYDCGTNARAVFLKLIETGRGNRNLSKSEISRMSREYLLNKTFPLLPMNKCFAKLRADDGENVVAILSVGFQDFGHVWVIEKKYFNGVPLPRYHHYQSALGSHMLIDFIESMDYGKDPMRSLNIVDYFGKLEHLLSFTAAWKDEQYRIFSELFAFMPVSLVTNPEPGFCWTWASVKTKPPKAPTQSFGSGRRS